MPKNGGDYKMSKPKREVVRQIPLTELHPFPDHPFKIRDDESMRETAESIKEYGVLVPALARPSEGGGYELIAGHRRKHGCELAGLETMPVIVRDRSYGILCYASPSRPVCTERRAGSQRHLHLQSQLIARQPLR